MNLLCSTWRGVPPWRATPSEMQLDSMNLSAIVSRSRQILTRGQGGVQVCLSLRGEFCRWDWSVYGVGKYLPLERAYCYDILLQGAGASRQYGMLGEKPRWFKKDWKKKRPAVVQNAAKLEERQTVIVVESPTKAKTIGKYLGSGYTVLPSYGHVRDLAARSGSVRPDDDFAMLWEVPATARSHIDSIKAALKGAETLVLASDPDREGEAIAWHVLEMLTMEGALKNEMQVVRVVFSEITKTAVVRALEAPRDISGTLVDAYLARRALDYLIGFDLSPVLWRKLPGSKSAGRVQSAALRLICDREQEIEVFQSREYWSVVAKLAKETNSKINRLKPFLANLTHWNGGKLGQFSLANSLDADAATKTVAEARLQIGSVKKRRVRRSPPAPYITSTLQQDASAKLSFGATRTMSVAQQLYEGVKLGDDEQTGLITYMRTDGVQMSNEAVESIRSLAATRYGKDYVPVERRLFISRVKNAQEAHEAIRPTDISRLPSTLVNVLEEDALHLYTLIWARTMACQLEQAVSNQVSLDVVDDNDIVQLRSTSSSVLFSGFLEVFKDTAALGTTAHKFGDQEADGQDEDFQHLEIGDVIIVSEVQPVQHFTEAPPRFSEGSLVKKLEELGIGRPSTYASTLRTLQLRNYVRTEKRRISPETRGRMVSAFLSHYFPEFADFDFTAKMETQLDEVSSGHANWKNILKSFWPEFHANVLEAMKVPINQVVGMLEEVFAKQFFPPLNTGEEDRICPSCKQGRVCLKLSRFGAGYFFGCTRYPDCLFKANMISGGEGESGDDEEVPAPSQWSRITHPPKHLGIDPTSQLEVVMRIGPYGAYVQLGETSKKQKPRRTTLPKGVKAEEVDLSKALELLSYPRELGKHPEEGTPVLVGIGKFGFFLRHRAVIASVPQGIAIQNLTMEKAAEILKGRNVTRRGRRPQKAVPDEAKAGDGIDHSARVVGEEVVSVHESQLSKDMVSLPSTSGSPGTSEQESKKELTRKRNKRRKSKSATNIDTSASVHSPAGSVSGSHQPKEVPSTKDETPSSLTPVISKRGRGRPRRIVDLPDRPQELASKVVHALHTFLSIVLFQEIFNPSYEARWTE